MDARDLKPITIPIRKPNAALTYEVVTPNQYVGPNNIGIPMYKSSSDAEYTTVEPPKASGNNEYIITDVKSETTGTGKTVNKYSTSSVGYKPVEDKPVPKTDHTHYATEIIETKDRLFLTEDERYLLRRIFSDGGVGTKFTRVMVFVISPDSNAGAQGEVLKFPWEGKMTKMHATCVDPSMSDTIVHIERCPKASYESQEFNWEELGTLTVKNEVIVDEKTVDIPVFTDDYYRLVIPYLSINEPLTVELSVKCSII